MRKGCNICGKTKYSTHFCLACWLLFEHGYGVNHNGIWRFNPAGIVWTFLGHSHLKIATTEEIIGGGF